MYTYWKNGGTYQPAKNDSLLSIYASHVLIMEHPVSNHLDWSVLV